MLTVTIPHLHGLAGGRHIPDLMPAGLGHAQAVDLLSALGEEGRRFYLTVQLPLDMVYPLASALAISLSLRALAGHLPGAAGRPALRRTVTWIPLIGALCDWGENTCTALMIRSFPQVPTALPQIGGMFSLGKSVFVSLGVLLLLLACVLALLARLSGRGRRGRPGTTPAA
ncbi:hypothetical protein MANAM107_22730 [Actinomyces capricornis]|uniref:Uncharacterized protein n=2 Tax=Actinomyces capricornis TaxID=2755559 RepID=A0ABN6KBR2_9ACTO|nr:hypothetical protein MANAM107_22730 [Actinomyces capricornis]